MQEFLRSLMPWGADVIVWVQQFSNGVLDALFKIATYMGKEEFYIFSLPVLYWCVSKYWGRVVAVVFLLSEYVNTFLKDTFAIQRPYDYDARIHAPLKETSPAFPSSHSQGSLVFWGGLAAQVKRSSMWIVSIVLILLISLSRIYLGVHYPQDVLGGWLIGIAILLLYFGARRALRGVILPTGVQLALAVAIPVLLFILHQSPSTGMVMGVLCGMMPGFVLEAKYVRFDAGGVWWKRVLRFVVGVIPLLALYLGLKVVFPYTEVFRFLRYALVGLWAGVLGPWVFVALKLADRERAS